MATGATVVSRVFNEVVNEKKIDLLDELFAQDYVDHGPMGDVTGRENVRALFAGFFQAVPDLHCEVGHLIEQGDTVGWIVTSTGTHTGDGLGFPATGKRFETVSANLGRYRDSRIVEHWSEQGMFPMLVQLGVIPRPAPA